MVYLNLLYKYIYIQHGYINWDRFLREELRGNNLTINLLLIAFGFYQTTVPKWQYWFIVLSAIIFKSMLSDKKEGFSYDNVVASNSFNPLYSLPNNFRKGLETRSRGNIEV